MEKITFFMEDEDGISRDKGVSLESAVRDLKRFTHYITDNVWVEVEDTEKNEKYILSLSEDGKIVKTTEIPNAVRLIKPKKITEEDVTNDKTVQEVFNELGTVVFTNYIKAISKKAIHALDSSFSSMKEQIDVNYDNNWYEVMITFSYELPEIKYEEKFVIDIPWERLDSKTMSVRYWYGKKGIEAGSRKEIIPWSDINVSEVLTDSIKILFFGSKESRDYIIGKLTVLSTPVDPTDFDNHNLIEICNREKDLTVFTNQIKDACDDIMSKVVPINSTGLAKAESTLSINEPNDYSIVYVDTNASNRSEGEGFYEKEIKIVGSINPAYIDITYNVWEGVSCSGNLTDRKLAVTYKSVVNPKNTNFLQELKSSILSAFQTTS